MADLLVFNNQTLGALLPERLRKRLSAAANRVRYKDGELIHGRGDANPGLSIVCEGAVQFGNPGADGSYVTTSIMGPGHYFGEATLFAALPRTHDAVAVGAAVVEQIEKKKFDRIFDEEPELARLLLIATTQRLYSMLEFMDDLRRLPLSVRAAKLIAIMARSSKDPKSVKCNQSDLAFTLGVSRVSIGKTLARLQKEGLIKCGYGQIGIPDKVALSAWIAERAELVPLSEN
jgi:CRP/FNR family transcriptional regulator, cyclic AMP receptor protein